MTQVKQLGSLVKENKQVVVRIHREGSSSGGAIVERLELSRFGRQLLSTDVTEIPAYESSSEQRKVGWVRQFLHI